MVYFFLLFYINTSHFFVSGTITSREADTITREAVITVAAGTTAAVVATSRETMDTMEDEVCLTC